MKREIVPFAPDAAVEWPSNPVATDTRQRDAAVAELVRLYDGGANPAYAANAMLEACDESAVAEALAHVERFSEHILGRDDVRWLAAVRAAIEG